GPAGQPSHRTHRRDACLAPFCFMAVAAGVMAKRARPPKTSVKRQSGIAALFPPQREAPPPQKNKFAMPPPVSHALYSKRGGKIIAWHEQYGIHEISSDDYDDQAPPKFFLEFRRLAEAAFELLRKHGEKSSGEIAKEILSTRPNNPGTAINEALF